MFSSKTYSNKILGGNVQMKVATIFGTRPEGIKMAPLVKEINNREELECVFINTAQHREMLDQVLDMFDITPDYDLDLMKKKQTPAEITSKILERTTKILEDEKPDLVLVHGDTATTFAGALAAFLLKIPVGHVEAGLRTGDITSPFPEEANRQLVGRIATYHFAATEKNKDALENERISNPNIYVVGNTVIDALLDVANRDFSFQEPLKSALTNGKRTILMTTHRRENMDQLSDVYKAINRIISEHDDVQIVFPVHKNPAIREVLKEHMITNDRVHIIEPQDYETFSHLMKSSHFILTDSGGIQEEAPALGKPVLVARNNTERPEGVEAGTLKLCGTNEEQVYTHMKNLLTDQNAYNRMSGAKNPYGIGNSAKQIVDIIASEIKK